MINGTEGRKPLLTILYVVGGFIGACLLLVGVWFVGAALIHEITKERPKFNTGKITQRVFDPAHYETEMQHQYAGEDCSYDYQSKRNVCHSVYHWVPVQVWHRDDWDIQIENCAVQKKDGTYWVDKQGNHKCYRKWIDVTHDAYDSVKVGDDWNG